MQIVGNWMMVLAAAVLTLLIFQLKNLTAIRKQPALAKIRARVNSHLLHWPMAYLKVDPCSHLCFKAKCNKRSFVGLEVYKSLYVLMAFPNAAAKAVCSPAIIACTGPLPAQSCLSKAAAYYLSSEFKLWDSLVVANTSVQVSQALRYQLPPYRFWVWWCGGLDVKDLFLVLLWVTYNFYWVYIKAEGRRHLIHGSKLLLTCQ